ncbi:MAG: hypothetical protein RIF41_21090 [Polyangiaceae bacterium]
MATLAGISVERVELVMERYGSWRADAVLTAGEPPTGQVTLEVSGLELLGTVLASGLDSPDRPRAVVVGAPGWERELAAPLSYQSAAGVRLATVLTDLASRSGEPIEQPADVPLGRHFATPGSSRRRRILLRDVLTALATMGHVAPWRVDPDGVTRFGDRAAEEVSARATELSRDAGLGRRTLGIDEPAAFLPGALFEGEVIKRLEVHERQDKTEAVIWQ